MRHSHLPGSNSASLIRNGLIYMCNGLIYMYLLWKFLRSGLSQPGKMVVIIKVSD